MIVLDTNAISEIMKPGPDARVFNWLSSQRSETLFLTTPTASELLSGVAFLPEGRRKVGLTASVEDVLDLFADRMLPFDMSAARQFAHLAARARLAGQPLPIFDAQIAAIALSKDFCVATRDERPFTAAGVKVINPWTWTSQ